MATGLDRRMRPRWGFLLVATNAVGGTALALYLLDEWLGDASRGGSVDSWWPALLLSGSGIISAWLAVWAWLTDRWGIAALTLVLSLAMPWGFFAVLSGPIVLGLATVAGVRAYRQRRRPTHEPTPRDSVFALGAAWLGIAAGVGLTVLRSFNGDDYDRGSLPTLAFGALFAVPGFLAFMARRDRPGLYLASGIIYVPASFISMAGVTLPLLFLAAMAFVAYDRHGDESLTRVPAPLTALVLFALTIASWAVLIFNGGDDPRCSSTSTSTSTSTSCTSDVITNGEALLSLAGVIVILLAGWLLSRPRQSGTAA